MAWTLTDEGTLRIIGQGRMADFGQSGYAPWFEYRAHIKTLIIEPGVASVGGAAFSSLPALAWVTIAESVTSVGHSAFAYCTGLSEVILPAGVTSVGEAAFASCSNLSRMNIPVGVTSIGAGAFAGCDELEAIRVEGGNANYTSVEGVLFSKDKSRLVQYPAGKAAVTYLIPAGVTTIGNYAFFGSYALARVVIPAGVTTIGDYAFEECTGLSSVVLPDGITTIGHAAFLDCAGLSRMVLPSSVTSIGEQAFAHCTNLTAIINLNPAPQPISGNTFASAGIDTLYVADRSIAAYQSAPVWNEFSTILPATSRLP
jgi:hypothetical protein